MYGLKDKATEIIEGRYLNPQSPRPLTQARIRDGNRYQLIVTHMEATR